MTKSNQEIKSWRVVCFAGFGIVLLLAFISTISAPFEYDSQISPPIITVSLLLIAATALAFLALRSALKMADSKRPLLFLIACIGISLRAIGLFTTPILEVDYYRYIWDGKVTAEGVSPYAYSPAQVLKADTIADPAYQEIVKLSVESESNFVILQRIHFAEFRTIYPPVSQFVFALSMKWLPDTASVEAHVLGIRTVFVMFDLLTLWLIFLTLKQLNFHTAWLIAYAWNPLIIKEVSNSGHLDSIVACLIMTSVYLITRWIDLNSNQRKTITLLLSGILLGLGVGAKLFPVVIFPALVITIARVRWSKALIFSLSFVATSVICLWPMYHVLFNSQQTSVLKPPANVAASIVDQSQVDRIESIESSGNIAGNNSSDSSPDLAADSKEGLTSFLSQWRMNDAIFSGIYLNLKPTGDKGLPWYVVTSDRFRQRLNNWCKSMKLGGENPAFFITRILTMTLFATFYLWQLNCIYREPQHCAGINFQRLTWIAVVFLLLQPTVNPWYWIWIAPLACLSRRAQWLLVAGCLMIYYSRFWFQSFTGTYHFMETSYSGVELFDHGVVWIEFTCIAAVLIWCGLLRKRTRREATN